MDVEQSSLAELLEHRLILMYELARSLERSHAAVLQSDIEQICAQTFQQQRICSELHRIGRTEGAGKVCKHPQLAAKLRQIENEITRLNLIYAALLRRARRTLDIFCRVLKNSDITYVAPARLHGIPPPPDGKG